MQISHRYIVSTCDFDVEIIELMLVKLKNIIKKIKINWALNWKKKNNMQIITKRKFSKQWAILS